MSVVKGSSLPANFWECVTEANLVSVPYLGWSFSSKMEDIETIEALQQGLDVCPNCKERWEQSGIVPSLLRVDWDTLTSEVCLYNKYTAHLLYESLFLKLFLFMKDPRLEMLLKGYKDATLSGFADGVGKVLACRLADFVLLNGICSLHRRSFLV